MIISRRSRPGSLGATVLNMLPNGKAVSKNGGVSWGFILRNDLVEIRLRKKPMSGIVAIVHFLAKALWLNSPKTCLDQMQSCLKTMWADPDAYKEVTFQLSQIHLCADIAHFPLERGAVAALGDAFIQAHDAPALPRGSGSG